MRGTSTANDHLEDRFSYQIVISRDLKLAEMRPVLVGCLQMIHLEENLFREHHTNAQKLMTDSTVDIQHESDPLAAPKSFFVNRASQPQSCIVTASA